DAAIDGFQQQASLSGLLAPSAMPQKMKHVEVPRAQRRAQSAERRVLHDLGLDLSRAASQRGGELLPFVREIQGWDAAWTGHGDENPQRWLKGGKGGGSRDFQMPHNRACRVRPQEL